MGKASQRTPGVVADAEGVVVEPEPVQNIPEFCLHGFGHRRLGSGTHSTQKINYNCNFVFYTFKTDSGIEDSDLEPVQHKKLK
jgi:hypothetical protein